MDLTAIRAAIATNLRTIDGLRCYSEWPDNPVLPAALITADDPYLEPHQTISVSHLVFVNFVITVAVSPSAGVDRAQIALDDLVADQIMNALYGTDRTLGGLVDDMKVESVSGLRQVPIAGVTYVAHEVPVQVLARHS